MNRKPKAPSSKGPLTEAAQRAKKLEIHHSRSQERLDGGTAVASAQATLSKALVDMIAQRADASSRRFLARNGDGRPTLVKRAQAFLKKGEEPRSLVSLLRSEFDDYAETSERRIREILKEEGLLPPRKRK